MPGLTRSDEDGPHRPRRRSADRASAVVRFLRAARIPRHARRHHTAGVVSGAALLAVLAAILVPLALPNRTVSRAAARSHQRPLNTGSSASAPGAAAAGAGGPGQPQATVTIAADAPSAAVPGSWFGVSTEYWALPLFEQDAPVFDRVLALLHVPGDGPLVLRIGGDSADHSFWDPKPKDMPSWAFALTPSFVSRLRALVLRDHLKLIIDLNLVTDTPLTAAAWAHAAETSLPKGSIVGFEIGNEPDLYSRSYWVATITRSPFRAGPLPFALTPDSYVSDFAAYATAIGETAPDIPLIGPAVAHPRVSADYITALIQAERPELGAITGHLYPYSACSKHPGSSSYPTVPRLLSQQASAQAAKDVASAVAIAHGAGLKFRLTELNSVTCGGKRGVSNTFATALWAPDTLFTLLRAGVDGANLHIRADAINAPFVINRGGLFARPLLYGLLLFTRTLGPQAHLVRLQMSAPRSLDFSAWAVRVRGGMLHVLLIDKSRRTVRVDLHLPTTAPATIQRLLAPSAYSRSGVTLDGQHLNAEADWVGTRRTETVTPDPRGGYVVTLPERSAALVGVSIARTRAPSKHHGRVAVAKHAVLTVRLHRSRKH
ncbi:MAG TPA: glycosyl hydrolase family 79 C-terminal domain-containing protein [Solirubrobacteraceae bacterium]|nr:glycosyl hydrolase family 79 C-terminal domain-containing protein [Solirubrobacteraceae bacterium]